MDGFWVHRALEEAGLQNVAVDSSSIETKRHGLHAKTDRLDAGALVTRRVGQPYDRSVVHLPPEGAEDERHNSRELRRLRDEQTALRNTIKGLLKTQGIRPQRVPPDFADQHPELRRWNGSALGSELQAQLLRLFARMQFVRRHIREVEQRRSELLEGTSNASMAPHGPPCVGWARLRAGRWPENSQIELWNTWTPARYRKGR